MMRQLSGRHSVYAPDMPGYGASDSLDRPLSSIEELADNVAGFMDALGIDRAGIYGFHTGASVANAFARRHSSRVAVAVLVGLLCLDEVERADLLQNYLPPFTAQWDGSHLAWAWARLKDQSLFFPWYRRVSPARVSMDGSSPAAIQAALNDWLRSGEGYLDAYRAAFRYRPERDLPHIATPHFILGYPSDPLFAHLERFSLLPSTVSIRRHATAAEAQTNAVELLQRFAASGLPETSVQTHPKGQRCRQDYLVLPGLQLRTLCAGDDAKPPLLLLHGAQGSVTAWRELIGALAQCRSVLALELPGHGESDPLPDDADYSIEDLADLVGIAVKVLGLSKLELVGIEAGAAILTVLAARNPASVVSLRLLNAIDVAANTDLRESLLASYPATVPADFFGGHLLRAWHEVRDHALFFPWHERRRVCGTLEDACLQVELLHKQTVDALLAGAAGYALRRAEIRCALSAHLADQNYETRSAAGRWSPRFVQSQMLAAGARLEFCLLPRDSQAWAPVVTEPRGA